jgi:hypothetical protein
MGSFSFWFCTAANLHTISSLFSLLVCVSDLIEAKLDQLDKTVCKWAKEICIPYIVWNFLSQIFIDVSILFVTFQILLFN